MIPKKFKKQKRADMNFINEADEHIKQVQSRITENSFYKMTGTTDFQESNILEDLKKIRDELTNALFCNTDDYDLLKEALDKQPGFYELIKTPYVESGNAILVTDKRLKMEILRQRRQMEISKTE